MKKYFTKVELTFEVPDHVGVPKWRGDAPIDYAARAMEHLRPALEQLIADAGSPVTGYFLSGPRRCECLALPQGEPTHEDRCREEDPRAEQCPTGIPRVIHLQLADDEEDDDEDQA